MSVWKKIFTAVKGHATEAAESIQDRNLLTILDQEIRDARQELDRAKAQKAKMVASRIVKSKEVDELKAEFDRVYAAAKKAKETGEVDDARAFAERAVELEARMNEAKTQADEYEKTVERMEVSIRQSQSKIDTVKRKIESAKANAAVINAQRAASTSSVASNGALSGAMDSLERLERKHAEQAALVEAEAREEDITTGRDLNERLKKYSEQGSSEAQKLFDSL